MSRLGERRQVFAATAKTGTAALIWRSPRLICARSSGSAALCVD